MDGALFAKDLLSSRDADAVEEAIRVMGEAGADGGSGGGAEPKASGAAVKIDREEGAPLREIRGDGRNKLRDVGIAFEDFSEPVFDDDGDFEVRAVLFKERQG